jgi:hypothetical protein
MQEDLLENVTEGQIYTTRAIVVSSFFGGLLAGSFMMYQNFKTFGEHKKAIATIVIAILTLLVIFATSFIPVLDSIPSIIYSIAITLIVSFLTKKYQDKLIDQHINTGGKIYSTGRAVLICVISILIIAAIILGAYYLQDASLTKG